MDRRRIRPGGVVAVAVAVAATLALAGCSQNSTDDGPTAAATTPPPVTTATGAPTTSAAPTTTSAAPTTSAPTGVDQVITVSVAGGKVTGPKGRVKVKKGSTVQLVITSDKADEVHLHGYDKEVKLKPGQAGALTFKATISGVFTVELHKNPLRLVQLQVA